MVTILNKYVGDSEGFKKIFRVLMEGQFERDLCDKSFSNQLESDVIYTLRQIIHRWMPVVDKVVLYLTMFMIIVLTNCLLCLVKL